MHRHDSGACGCGGDHGHEHHHHDDAHECCGGQDHDHAHDHAHEHAADGSCCGGHDHGRAVTPVDEEEDHTIPDPTTLPADLREIESIVQRVRGDIEDYRAQVARGGVKLSGDHVLMVLDQALAEAEHGAGYAPQFEPTVEGFQMLGLYEEVVQLASNTYEEKVYPDGTKVWVSVAPATWRACLERVRKLEAAAT